MNKRHARKIENRAQQAIKAARVLEDAVASLSGELHVYGAVFAKKGKGAKHPMLSRACQSASAVSHVTRSMKTLVYDLADAVENAVDEQLSYNKPPKPKPKKS